MKRLLLIGILSTVACQTTTAVPDPPTPDAAKPDVFATVEQWISNEHPGGWVERMHRDGGGYVALVATEDPGVFVLVHAEQHDGTWSITHAEPGPEDYLWPEQ